MNFVATPDWAIREVLAEHQERCEICQDNACAPDQSSCGVGLALCGSLEDGVLEPIRVGQIIPDVVYRIRKRQLDQIYTLGSTEPIYEVDL